MADARKIFPVEQVMELVAGKDSANINEIASQILGRPITTKAEAKTAAPFAAAWLARLHPKFMDMEWKEGESFSDYLKKVRGALGANISIEPMSGRVKALAGQALDALKDAEDSLRRQTDAAVKLEQKVAELQPLEAAAQALQKKNDELEAKLKSMKADLGALQRKAAEFQGKLAIDHDELVQNIKDAIKDGLKGLAVGGVAAGAAAAGAAEQETAKPTGGVPDDFGFGESGADADGFGF